MSMPFRFSLVASLTSALLSTSALIPNPVQAAITADDAGVSMRVQPGAEAAPALRMITRSEIQGERFQAGALEVVDLLLTDGTSLTMAAGTMLVVDEYSYDPASLLGDLAIDLEEGTLRLIGGTLNNTQPITVTTPTATLILDNATAVIVVDADGATRAALEFGKELTVTTDDGETVAIMKPGFEVAVAPDGMITGPVRRPPGAAMQIAQILNPGLITGLAPELDESVTGEGDDQEVTARDDDPTEFDEDIDEPGRDDPEVQDDLTEIEPEIPPFDIGGGGGATDGGGGFEAGVVVGAINLTENQPGILEEPPLLLRQDFVLDDQSRIIFIDPDGNETAGEPFDDTLVPKLRPEGLTTQSIYLGDESFTQTRDGDPDNDPQIGGDFIYGFNGTFIDTPEFFTLGSPPEERTNPFILDILFQEDGEFVPGRVFEGLDAQDLSSGSIFELALGNTILGIDEDENAQRAPTIIKMLQNGFSNDPVVGGAVGGIGRNPDNFIMMQARPALASDQGRLSIIEEFNRRQENDELGAATFLVSAFGLGVEPIPGAAIDVRRFDFTLSDDETLFLANGLAEALQSPDPVEAVRVFLAGTDLTDEQRHLAIEQLTRQERFVFAAGDVDADLDTERRLDIYYVTPGLDGFDEDGNIAEGATVATSIRAFLRNATALREEDGSGGIALGDTGLMIIGRPANSVPGLDPDEQSGLLHADIGMDGAGENQRSTVSVTIGHVQYDAGETGEEVVLEGRTIGSTQDEGAGASTLAGGDLFNSSAGGGRPVDTDGDDVVDGTVPGRATYFVIENVEPMADEGEPSEDVAGDDRPQSGGSERPMGNRDADSDFAILRLATGKSSIALEPGEGGEFAGVSAGMLETETGGDQVSISPVTSEFKLELSPETNRIAVDGATFDFGGISGEDSKGESVYIDDDRFAARTNDQGSDLAMVSGKVLQDAVANLPEGNATREFLDVPDYKHLKWGFFFGDTAPVTGENGETLRQHIHLGSWVAGKMADPSRLPTSGTATYKGHAFGSVLNGQALYAARGSYKNEWNFGSRAGFVTMGFDGAKLQGLTKLEDGTIAFVGSLKGDDREAGVSGVFIQGKRGERQPAGQLGTFQVRGKRYNAIGTFGAERVRK